MNIFLIDDLLVLFVQAGVEHRVSPERDGHRLHQEGHRGQLDVRAEESLGHALAEVFEIGHVGVVEVGHVGDGACGSGHLGGDGLPDAGHLFAADRPPVVFARVAGRDDRLEADRSRRPSRSRGSAGRRSRRTGARGRCP
jgi:hypothetical protein